MRSMSRAVLAGAASAAALALIAGCGEGGTAESADPGASSAPVTVGYSTDGGQNYDPASAGNQYVSVYLLPVYDSLLSVDPSGEVLPSLAESFELNDSQTAYDVKIRLAADMTRLGNVILIENMDFGEMSTLEGEAESGQSVGMEMQP